MALFDGLRRKRGGTQSEATSIEPVDEDTADEPRDGPSTWYRAKYVNIVPAGDNVLLHDPEQAAPVMLPSFELELLTQCTYFAPIEAHAEAAARHTGLPAEGIAQRLYELLDQGLLISQRDVLARARAAAEANQDSAPTLDRVAVVTSDRPASLANCLRSYRDRYGAELELVVFDDSAEAAARAENRRVATEAAAGGRTLYAGADEKQRFVAELTARSGIEPEVVRAAMTEFDGCTFHVGANRNAALLDAAGGVVLIVDDDTTARTAYPTNASDVIRLSSRYDPWSLHFFANLDDALHAADWRDTDLIAWHRRFLGRPPAVSAFDPKPYNGSLPLDTDAALDLNEADSALVAAFSRGRGRVVATNAGVVGDSGMGLPLSFLSLQGAERERLIENYESNRATRAVHRGADVVTLSNTQFFMTAHVAFDVRDTIPPFSPALRNSDGVFGALLRTCAPESYVAFLPWRIEHIPPDPRPTDFDQIVRSVSRVRTNDIIRDLAHAHDPAPGVVDANVRLRAFGQYLAALGAMPAADFDGMLHYQIMTTIGRRIERLTRAVNQENGEPAQWAEDCAAVIAEGHRALTEDELVVADIPGATADERHRRFQRLLYRFGRVLDAWPALLDAATELRVAEPLTSR
jgi:hypothetical protein